MLHSLHKSESQTVLAMAATCFKAPAIFYLLAIILVYLVSPNVQTGKTDTCETNSGANFAFLGNIYGFRTPPLTKLNSPGTRHFGHSSSTAFFAVRIERYPNSSSTFQLEKVVASGDVSLNPGPEKCKTCTRAIAFNHRRLCCASCTNRYHLKCAAVKSAEYKLVVNTQWICLMCYSRELMKELAFGDAEECGFNVEDGLEQIVEETIYDDGLSDFVNELEYGTSNKDVRLAHLNVCSLRNKIEEVRCLQLLCKFEIFAITKTHLDKNIPHTEIDIPGMKFVRLDRKGRKGGGCLLYYAEYLQATHRRDLFTQNIEAEWLQVKFPSSSVLFSVIYRPQDASGEFFKQIGATLEKAWLKTSNIVLLGDFNCDFQGDSELSANARKLRLFLKCTICKTL